MLGFWLRRPDVRVEALGVQGLPEVSASLAMFKGNDRWGV